MARQRCWAYDWVLDLDIKGFFDNIDWSLLMRAVRRHTDCKWVLLYGVRPIVVIDGGILSPRSPDDFGTLTATSDKYRADSRG